MTANVAGYLLQLLASRWLGVSGYSPFASLLAVQLLCAVPALALQNVVAREVVRGAGIGAARALAWRCAALVAAVAVVLVPVVSTVLDVGVWAAAAALGAAPVLVLLSGEQGILQGQRRFRELATVLGGAGVARVTPAIIVLAIGGGTSAALWAAAAGIAVAAVSARLAAGGAHTVAEPAARVGSADSRQASARAEQWPIAAESEAVGEERSTAAESEAMDADGPRRAGSGFEVSSSTAADDSSFRAGDGDSSPRRADGIPSRLPGDSVSAEAAGQATRAEAAGVVAVLRAAQLQAALMALSSADLIVSRIVLETDDAGRYALGAVATKIAFWLPQAVGVVLYPRMAQPQHSAQAVRSALAVLSAIGVLAVAGAAVAAPLAPLFAGQDYAPVQGLLWLFALDGALLAVLQAALLSAIAADRTAPAALTWLGLAAGVAAMLTLAHSVLGLITIATTTAAITTAVIAALALGATRRPQPVTTST
ncbi:polysaccharide biosynthesis protein [Nocardia otitidiscaviarum]|uniref:polysaccharide biosynthesis protein n=1 Tax=Nocardia otitidiscaviarum TaxID=1823 RepID=UPI000693970B|nr:polysaccharide biosynthesis protein [Nocardia otitidiscaviarum]MBF6137085.1 polysaccharide biosynthesis protein [Nocardia otitidiscaviarum]MBF6487984.1 polysaccharide biosynthesis protein [Nocardia otitidiscaviarum]